MITFEAVLWRVPGSAGWTFVTVPESLAPPAAGLWGRTPVHAEVDGRAWATSLWRDRSGLTLLPVPAACAAPDSPASASRCASWCAVAEGGQPPDSVSRRAS